MNPSTPPSASLRASPFLLSAVFAVSSAFALPPSKRSSAPSSPPPAEPPHKYSQPSAPERQTGQEAGLPSAPGGRALSSSDGAQHGRPASPSATPAVSDAGSPAGGFGEGGNRPSSGGSAPSGFLGGIVGGGKTDNGKGNGGSPGEGGQNNGGGKGKAPKSVAAPASNARESGPKLVPSRPGRSGAAPASKASPKLAPAPQLAPPARSIPPQPSGNP